MPLINALRRAQPSVPLEESHAAERLPWFGAPSASPCSPGEPATAAIDLVRYYAGGCQILPDLPRRDRDGACVCAAALLRSDGETVH
jgi:hypothetical protein